MRLICGDHSDPLRPDGPYRDVLIGRALIMLLVALGIFAGAMTLMCRHADTEPWPELSLSAGR